MAQTLQFQDLPTLHSFSAWLTACATEMKQLACIASTACSQHRVLEACGSEKRLVSGGGECAVQTLHVGSTRLANAGEVGTSREGSSAVEASATPSSD